MIITGISLDTNVVNSTKDTYSSVTDLNDVDLFTERIHTGAELVRAKENEQYITIGDMLFVCNMDSTNIYEETSAKMFEHIPALVKKEYVPPRKLSMLFVTSVVSLLLAVILCVVALFFKRKHRKERESADNYYTY